MRRREREWADASETARSPRSAARAPEADELIADSARLAGRLADGEAGPGRGVRAQRVAATLQRMLGNRRAAAVLAPLQRAPRAAPGDAGGPESASTMAVITHLSARVHAEPRFLGARLVDLSRGERVPLTGVRRGDWYEVVLGDGRTGWLHRSAFSSQTVRLVSTPGTAGRHPEPEEVEIAGRG